MKRPSEQGLFCRRGPWYGAARTVVVRGASARRVVGDVLRPAEDHPSNPRHTRWNDAATCAARRSRPGRTSEAPSQGDAEKVEAGAEKEERGVTTQLRKQRGRMRGPSGTRFSRVSTGGTLGSSSLEGGDDARLFEVVDALSVAHHGVVVVQCEYSIGAGDPDTEREEERLA
jgi:hypothetical protein